ncbi:hypothetical protein D9M72_409930 [compost metagenome]
MEDLGERTNRGRALEGGLEGHQALGAHRHILEQHRPAAGGALTEAGPVVDNGQPGGVARHEGEVLVAILAHHQGRYALGVEGSGAIELAAVDAIAGAFPDQPRIAVIGGAGADLGQGVAEALAGQGSGEQAALLGLAAVHPEDFQGVEMVLRDLSEGGIGGTDDGDDPRQGHPRYASATELARHADTPQARAGEGVEFLMGQAPVAVAIGSAGLEPGGDAARHVEGFGIVADDGNADGRGGLRQSHGELLRSRNDGPAWRR